MVEKPLLVFCDAKPKRLRRVGVGHRTYARGIDDCVSDGEAGDQGHGQVKNTHTQGPVGVEVEYSSTGYSVDVDRGAV